MAMVLVWPAVCHLPGVRDALARGWSPDTRREEAAREELAQLDADPAAYVAAQVDREARGGPIALPDGRSVPRLPGFRRWMWDDGFCGAINLRWQPGTTDLPSYCPGHIGYGVVPWMRGRGHATRALALMLVDARNEGLPFVIVTTDPANFASRRVIENNGGVLVAPIDASTSSDEAPSLLFRIDTARGGPACSASG